MTPEEQIWEAVETAISSGIDPTKFFQIVRQAWPQILRDQAGDAAREIDRLTQQPWK